MDGDGRSAVDLSGVSETMLWTLHNRACEVRRPDSMLHDPDCLRVYDSIDYDFERSFGKPDTSHPMRSRICDAAVRPWMAAHPGGTVVELAAGLETEFQRCDDGQVQWLCVDVPRLWRYASGSSQRRPGAGTARPTRSTSAGSTTSTPLGACS